MQTSCLLRSVGMRGARRDGVRPDLWLLLDGRQYLYNVKTLRYTDRYYTQARVVGSHADRASPVEHRAELVHEEYATAIAKLDATFSPHIVDPSARPLTRRLNEHPRVVGLVFGQFGGVSKAVHTLLVVGREVGQTPGRQRRLKTSQKGSNHARQKNRRGAAPKHRRGKHHTGGNSPQGNPTRQHTPHRESSTSRGPRCKIGRGGRRSSDFRVKQRALPTAGSCSHRVAEKLYAGKEDPRTSA